MTRSPPDSVGVPVLVDNDLAGADGHGAGLVVGLQVVFSQEDSVGATAARTHKKNHRNKSQSCFSLRSIQQHPTYL